MRHKTYSFTIQLLAAAGLAICMSSVAGATSFTPVSIASVASNTIQTNLISSFPTGPSVTLGGVTYNLPAGPNNFYDGFGFNGSGKSITLTTSVYNPTDVYTLMNAYFNNSALGLGVASVTFSGTNNTSETFTLLGGEVIRDFYQGAFTNSLTNGETGITATNVFSCSDPSTCKGAGGTGNVNTGLQGTYVIDQQDFALGNVFAGQTLTSITITDLNNSTVPLLLGVTVGSANTSSTPEPNGCFLAGLGAATLLWRKARRRARS